MAERNKSREEDELRDSISDDIDEDMMLGGKMDPPLDSQEELLGVALALPASETNGATLGVANSEGRKERRRNGERPCQGLPTFSDSDRSLGTPLFPISAPDPPSKELTEKPAQQRCSFLSIPDQAYGRTRTEESDTSGSSQTPSVATQTRPSLRTRPSQTVVILSSALKETRRA